MPGTRIKRRDLDILFITGILDLNMYLTFRCALTQTKLFTRQQFYLDSMTNHQCVVFLRFDRENLLILCKELGIPKSCRSGKGDAFTGIEGLCILLARLASPGSLYTHIQLFNRDRTSLSCIFRWMVDYINYFFAQNLSHLHQKWMTHDNLQYFAKKFEMAGSPLPNVVAFIDGTARPICRPTRNQEDYFSGHKWRHVLKYQVVTFPNGLIGCLDGPFPGCRHDAFMLPSSHILHDMRRHWVLRDGTFYRLFGDKGYSHSKFVAAPYKGNVTAGQALFNGKVGKIRMHVEYGFGKVVNLFPFVDFIKKNKILLQPVAHTYVAATFLTNCHSCFYGNQVSETFDCPVMPIQEYL